MSLRHHLFPLLILDMHPTNVVVIIFSALVGLIRIPLAIKFLFGVRFLDKDLGNWRPTIILAPLTNIAPLIPCIVSIAFASRGLTAYGLQVQLITFSTLSLADLVRNPHTIIKYNSNVCTRLG